MDASFRDKWKAFFQPFYAGFTYEGKKDTSATIKAYNFGASIGDLHFYGIYFRAGVGCGGRF